MELSQVAKGRKKGKGPQSVRQRAQAVTGNQADPRKSLDELAEMLNASGRATKEAKAAPLPPREPPVSPHVPPRRGLGLGGKVGIGAGVLAAGGTGAYLYKRRRVEKSLSSMRSEFPTMMMRST